MKKLNLIIDMDDVIYPLQSRWFEWVNKTYDEVLSKELVTSWRVHEYAQCGKDVYKYFEMPGVFLVSDPVEGAVDELEKLHDKGHKITFCTSPPLSSPHAEEEKIEWLKHWIPFFNPDTDIIFTQDKSTVEGDVIFDDRLKWLWEFSGISVAMDFPYNKPFEGYRVVNYMEGPSWKQFGEIVQDLSKVLK